MQDSIFQYPDNLDLRQRKQESTKQQRRVIVKQQKLPEEMTRFYDKNTFDFNFMFVGISGKSRDIFQAKSNPPPPRTQYQAPKRPTQMLNREASLSIEEGNSLSQQLIQNQKRGENNGQADIQQKSQERGAYNNKRQKNPWQNFLQKQSLHSYKVPQKQEPNKISESIPNQQSSSQWPSESIGKQSSSRIEQSAISGLHEITNQHQSQIEKQEKEQKAQQKEQEIDIFGVPADLSSISHNKNSESIMDLLKRLEESKDIKEGIVEGEQDEKCRQERARKEQQINQMPMKKLVYILKTSNCFKVCLKVIINPLIGSVKIKHASSSNFFKIESPKKIIQTSEPKEQIRWEVGTSKTQISPFALALTCYHCRSKENAGILNSQKYCIVICNSVQCKKQIYVEVKRIQLQTINLPDQ